jgi:hypothetical protein
MQVPSRADARRWNRLYRVAGLFPLTVVSAILAQSAPAAQEPAGAHPFAVQATPIAIVPIDNANPDQAPTVAGALEVTAGKAIIAASGSITSGTQTTRVILPRRGELRICASTTVKLAADSSVPAGNAPGLLMAMDHGAIEMSFAAGGAALRNADILLTPDFRILIGGPGSAEVKVRLGPQGDTCVDNAGVPSDRSSSLGWNAGVPSDRSSSLGWNAGANAPYVLVSSIFEGGDYRVQPGQRVMFQHGSLHEVVDQEKESCGCPPAAPKGNEFPVAQSEGLAPMPAPVSPSQSSAAPQVVAPLVYQSANHAPQPASVEPAPAPSTSVGTNPTAPQTAAQKKPGFFSRVGSFFKRIFGAE